VPRFKLINSERVYFVLVNSTHFIHLHMFGASNQVFFNHSSIHSPIKSDTPALLQVHKFDESYERTILDNTYAKRQIRSFLEIGTVYIISESEHYYRQMTGEPTSYYSSNEVSSLETQKAITDRMKIQIVRNVDVEPRYKSLYLTDKGNSFTFRILEGSGFF